MAQAEADRELEEKELVVALGREGDVYIEKEEVAVGEGFWTAGEARGRVAGATDMSLSRVAVTKNWTRGPVINVLWTKSLNQDWRGSYDMEWIPPWLFFSFFTKVIT